MSKWLGVADDAGGGGREVIGAILYNPTQHKLYNKQTHVLNMKQNVTNNSMCTKNDLLLITFNFFHRWLKNMGMFA